MPHGSGINEELIGLDHGYAKDPGSEKRINILGLNVCGLQSKVKLGILEEYVQDFDVVCLSETKCDNVDSDTIAGFYPIVMSKKNDKHRLGGVHGICIFVKNCYKHAVNVVNDTKSDSVLWIEINESAFGEGNGIIIGAVYLPHEGSDYHCSDIFDNLAEDIININTNYDLPVALVGDFNARTGVLDDFVSAEDAIAAEAGIDLADDDFFHTKHQLDSLGVNTERHNRDSNTNNNGYNLIEILKGLNLKIVNGRFGSDTGVGEYTCHVSSGKKLVGKSTVDYVIVSPALMPIISDFYIDSLDKCLSDAHCAICVSLRCGTGKSNYKTPVVNANQECDASEHVIDTNHKSVKTVWDNNLKAHYAEAFKPDDIAKLDVKIEHLDINHINQAELDTLTKELCKMCIDSAKQIGVTKEVRDPQKPNRNNTTPKKPWFDILCQNKRSEYFRVKNRLRKIHTLEAKAELKLKANEYKKLVRKTYRTYNKDLHKRLRNLKTSKPKEYWSILNKASNQKDKVGNIALQTFMEHFKKLSQKPVSHTDNRSDNFDPRTIQHSVNEEINKPVTITEVKCIVSRLKNNKACGIDSIVNEYLKHCPEEILVIIVKLFNVVLRSGIVPTDWCVGMIKPLYKKKGSADDPDNYRGITLLSCVGKLFTACLNSRLTAFIEGAGILGEEQAGFRENYSTLDHIFVLHSLIDLYLHRKKRIYCAFIDYKKAFDLVDRSSLWLKLTSCGINGDVIKVVYNMYDKAKSCVKQGHAVSNLFACEVGVRQGENLSPLLFAIYLNDFEYYVSRKYKGLNMCATEISENLSDNDVEVFLRLYVLLYADDTIVMAESAEELQLALNEVNQYCTLWHLTVNTSKTKIVIFSRGKVRNYPTFFFGNANLQVVNDYVYLGTTFNYNGLFNKAINKQVNQARRAMFNLVTKSRKLCLPVDIQCELFDQLVLPILLYGSEIWGFQQLDQIEMFYKKFLKNLLKLNRNTANCMVYGEVGRFSLNSMVEKRMINFWLHVCQGKQAKFSHTIYKLLLKLHEKQDFKSKWIVKIKSILDKSGLSNMWDQQTIVNKEWLKQCVDRRLKDMDIQNWNSEVNRNRLCTNYKIFKNEVGFEKYLVKLDTIDRINLCKFRCGNHRLPAAAERYLPMHVNKPCTLCESQDRGDEFHYILVCPAIKQIRDKYVKRYYSQRPNTVKMAQLFNVHSVKLLAALAKFVKFVMSLF